MFPCFRFKKVQGLMWEGTAISNAKWTGVRLRVSFRQSFLLYLGYRMFSFPLELIQMINESSMYILKAQMLILPVS